MKKIFRMALVFALAGATLLYTGCTKDYDEEINALDSELSSLQSDYATTVSNLQSEISSLKSSLSSLESAYKAADSALQKAIDANASDIKSLQSAVDAVKSSISSLESKVKANEDALAQLKKDLELYATKEELNAAKTGLEDKIAAEKKALEDKIAAEKKALEDEIAAVKSELLAKAEALGKEVETLKSSLTADEAKIKANADAIAELQQADKDIKDIYAALSDELRSIVFIPDLYYAGIEATEYTYAMVAPYEFLAAYAYGEYESAAEAVKKSKSEAYVTDAKVYDDDSKEFVETVVTIPWDQVISTDLYDVQVGTDPSTKKPINDVKVYSIGHDAVANYNLNPSSFDVEKAEWSIVGADYDYIIRGDELPEPMEATWKPVFKSIASENGNAAVTYTIENPERLSGLESYDYLAYIAYLAAKGSLDSDEIEKALDYFTPSTVSIINLVADLGEKTIESDYEAIVADPEFFAHLAFGSDTKYYTENELCFSIDEKNNRALYFSLDGAITMPYSVDVLYNGGPVDLSKYITIHMSTADEAPEAEFEVTLDELNELYGDRFHFEFAPVEYTLGYMTTPENAYATITEDGIYTPQYVITNTEDNTWKSYDCPKGDDKTGISSVGRYPVVQVTLYDGENIVLSGFFKTKIVKAARQADNIEIVIPNLGEVPYLCTGDFVISSWHQFSSLVLEKVGMDYNEFVGYYQPERVSDGEGELVIYVKNAKGEYVPLTETEIKKGENYTNDYFGEVFYGIDIDGSGVNNAFAWFVDPMHVGAGKTQTIYVHLYASEYENLWVELSASVADKDGVSFGVKNPAYWFDDIEDEVEINTVRANVLVPNATEDDVTVFTKDLDDYFIGNKLTVAFAKESDYAKVEVEYVYQFSAVQPEIVCEEQGVKEQLVANVDGSILFVAAKDTKGAYIAYDAKKYDAVYADATGKFVLNDFQCIAKLEPTGELTYTWAEGDIVSKTLLNLWGKEETDDAKMLYCNIDVIATYGECTIPAGDMAFHVRFIRPVSASKNEAGKLVDAVPGGSEVALGQILAATDWQNFEIFSYVPTTYKKDGSVDVEAYFKPGTYTTVNGTVINWFEYYGFETLSIDFSQVMTNQTGEWKLLSEVNPAAILKLYNGDTVVEETEGVAEADLTEGATDDEIPALLAYKLHYENNMGVVKDFQFSVPVALEYSWGTLIYDAVIDVDWTYTEK